MRDNLLMRYPSLRETIEEGDPAVTHLNLYAHGLNDNDIADLQEALQCNHYICSLDLSNNNITDRGCEMLRLIPALKKVDLSRNHITDNGIPYLLGTTIEWLDLSRCAITDAGASLLLKHIDQFKRVKVCANRSISEELEYQIDKKFIPNLEHPAICRERREALGIPDIGLLKSLGLWSRPPPVEIVFVDRMPVITIDLTPMQAEAEVEWVHKF